MNKIIFSAIILLNACIIKAQHIQGKITDETNEAIPNATIYIEELKSGIASNINGEFRIKVSPGTYTLQFKNMGFEIQKRTVEIISADVVVDVSLKPLVYELKEVTISSKDEDAAYAIMRKAIALAPFHLREVKQYHTVVYLKGTVLIDKMPKILTRMTTVKDGNTEIKLKTGDVYVEESVLEINFNAPNFYKSTVKSLRSSFPGNSNNPVNPVSIMKSSFYEPEIADLISPLAPKAFQHYNFRYMGYSEDGGQIINKIQVIPKRKSQDLYSGNIYIVDGKWCLHSLELNTNQFWGTLFLKIMYGKVNSQTNTWLPISYTFNVDGSVMGIKGRYRYMSALKYLKVQMNESLGNMLKPDLPVKPGKDEKLAEKADNLTTTLSKDKITNKEMKKATRQINELSSTQRKDTLTNEKIKEMTKTEVDSMSKKRDTSYWGDFRPVPLTAEELKSFDEGPTGVIQKVKKDSIALAKDTAYLSKKRKNPLWIITGKSFKLNEKRSNIRWGGLIQPDKISFNTVDGFKYGLSSNTWFNLDSGRWLKIEPFIGYAFSRKTFLWDIKFDWFYNNKQGKWSRLILNAGNKSTDFNSEKGVSPFMNSIYSLFLRENYMKLYNQKYIEVINSNHIIRQVKLIGSFKYDIVNELANNSDYSFFYRNKRDYSANIPTNTDYKPLEGETWRDFIISAGIYFAPEHKPKGDGYIREYNPYPRFTLMYTRAIPDVFSSNSDFQVLSLTADKRYWLGRNRVFKYQLNTLYWLSSKKTYFSNFSQVKTNYLPFNFSSFDHTFQLLPYYVCNTNKWSIDGHAQYQSKLLVLKRLPFISNRIWTENLYFNYLYNPNIRHYIEFGYGVGHLWAVGEIAVYSSFENFNYRSVGLKFCLKFD